MLAFLILFSFSVVSAQTLPPLQDPFRRDKMNPEDIVDDKPFYLTKKGLAYGSLGVFGIYLLAQLEDSPVLFASIYAAGSLFYLREIYDQEQSDIQYLTPGLLLAAAIFNVSYFTNDNDFSNEHIFYANLIAVAGIGSFEYFRRKNKNWPELFGYRFHVFPQLAKTGLANRDLASGIAIGIEIP